jgi:hypothetical protein
LNLRLHAPKACALAGLRHAPKLAISLIPTSDGYIKDNTLYRQFQDFFPVNGTRCQLANPFTIHISNLDRIEQAALPVRWMPRRKVTSTASGEVAVLQPASSDVRFTPPMPRNMSVADMCVASFNYSIEDTGLAALKTFHNTARSMRYMLHISLLISQRFDRVEPGSFPGRVDTEEDTDGCGKEEGKQYSIRRDNCFPTGQS